jgi:hypothetical protein
LFALLMQKLELWSSSLRTIVHFPIRLIVPFGITIPLFCCSGMQDNANIHNDN